MHSCAIASYENNTRRKVPNHCDTRAAVNPGHRSCHYRTGSNLNRSREALRVKVGHRDTHQAQSSIHAGPCDNYPNAGGWTDDPKSWTKGPHILPHHVNESKLSGSDLLHHSSHDQQYDDDDEDGEYSKGKWVQHLADHCSLVLTIVDSAAVALGYARYGRH